MKKLIISVLSFISIMVLITGCDLFESDGRINITTNISGAKAFLDGSPLSSATTLVGASPGDHEILVLLEGYKPYFTVVNVPSGDEKSVVINLEAYSNEFRDECDNSGNDFNGGGTYGPHGVMTYSTYQNETVIEILPTLDDSGLETKGMWIELVASDGITTLSNYTELIYNFKVSDQRMWMNFADKNSAFYSAGWEFSTANNNVNFHTRFDSQNYIFVLGSEGAKDITFDRAKLTGEKVLFECHLIDNKRIVFLIDGNLIFNEPLSASQQLSVVPSSQYWFGIEAYDTSGSDFDEPMRINYIHAYR